MTIYTFKILDNEYFFEDFNMIVLNSNFERVINYSYELCKCSNFR